MTFNRLEFARRLKAERALKGMTQTELAHAAGVNQKTVSDYETCKTEPSLELVGKIAAALGVMPDTMVGWGYPTA